MDASITRRHNSFTLCGKIRLEVHKVRIGDHEYEKATLYVGDRDVALMIQIAQRDAAVEDAGGGERTATSCRVNVEYFP